MLCTGQSLLLTEPARGQEGRCVPCFRDLGRSRSCLARDEHGHSAQQNHTLPISIQYYPVFKGQLAGHQYPVLVGQLYVMSRKEARCQWLLTSMSNLLADLRAADSSASSVQGQLYLTKEHGWWHGDWSAWERFGSSRQHAWQLCTCAFPVTQMCQHLFAIEAWVPVHCGVHLY